MDVTVLYPYPGGHATKLAICDLSIFLYEHGDLNYTPSLRKERLVSRLVDFEFALDTSRRRRERLVQELTIGKARGSGVVQIFSCGQSKYIAHASVMSMAARE